MHRQDIEGRPRPSSLLEPPPWLHRAVSLKKQRPNRALPAQLGPSFGRLGQRYCFWVVALKDPGVVLPMSELPWNDSIVPPLSEMPVLFCAMMLSEMRMAEVELA